MLFLRFMLLFGMQEDTDLHWSPVWFGVAPILVCWELLQTNRKQSRRQTKEYTLIPVLTFFNIHLFRLPDHLLLMI